MRSGAVTLLVGLAGCGFSVGAGDGPAIGDGRIDAPPFSFDGPVPVLTVSHLEGANAAPGEVDLILTTGVIDTTALSITNVTLATNTFTSQPQLGGGSEVAVLRVGSLTLPAGATIQVVGDRPLIVIAASDITIEGALDGGATRGVPGPGGARQLQGRPGQGATGVNDGNVGDSGGAGGGFGSAGGTGGAGGNNMSTLSVPRTAGGAAHGDAVLGTLGGGGAGGVGSPCAEAGGAGGGAIQLSAFGVVRISGGVSVAGGGGHPGRLCPSTGGSAGGGGSGGALFVEAPRVELTGIVAANGGSGGAGSDSPAGLTGRAGVDGLMQLQAAPGAATVGATNVGAAGGNGGWRDDAPATGVDTTYGNGGGGGGAVGRIVLRAASIAVTGDATPTETTVAF